MEHRWSGEDNEQSNNKQSKKGNETQGSGRYNDQEGTQEADMRTEN